MIKEKTKAVPEEIRDIVAQFAVSGEVTETEQIKKGYINRTYCVTLDDGGRKTKYTLQRINTDVFPDVDMLMDNFFKVTEHLRDTFILPGAGEMGSVQRVILTHDGKPYCRAESGCWRLLSHFTDVYSVDIPEKPEDFYYAGRAFGKFAQKMSDVPVCKIGEVIKNFHNTYSRYCDLERSIEKDPVGRVSSVTKEIEFVRSNKKLFPLISDALDCGRIPLRICHNDCNLNNILFDVRSRLPVAVIDLDTVMPGTLLYDYGDSMRIGTNTAKDDEKDLTKVHCDLSLYALYARGYLESAGMMMTEEELALLPFASLVITSEDGIRFLMDYIDGDTYYTTSYEGQNLDRSRTQLTLLADMKAKLPEIKKILADIYTELGLNGDPYKYSDIFGD